MTTTIDIAAASSFMATHARVLDRRRFQLLVGEGEPAAVLGALEAYRNADGGYGWGLEPDLRAVESQPGSALHAFEAMADAGPARTPHAVALCDWLSSVSLPDGGVPFAFPVADRAGVAPFWAEADPTTSSLQITAFVAAMAHRVARHDPAVAAHPWLARASDCCLAAIRALGDDTHALVLVASAGFVDAAHAGGLDVREAVERLRALLPASGVLRVGGGADEEAVRPLDFSSYPDGPIRALLAPDVITADLERLAGLQEDDGGWVVDYRSYSPAAELEWRGYATVRAVAVLQRHGMSPPEGRNQAR